METIKLPDPKKALAYFEDKVAFTTGPIEVDYLWKETRGGFNIIDVRAAKDFHDCHVPGAVCLPEDQWESCKGLSKDKLNVVYCYSHVCHLAAKAAVVFAKAGYPVMEMDGGFEEWMDNNLGVIRDENLKEIEDDLNHSKPGAA